MLCYFSPLFTRFFLHKFSSFQAMHVSSKYLAIYTLFSFFLISLVSFKYEEEVQRNNDDFATCQNMIIALFFCFSLCKGFFFLDFFFVILLMRMFNLEKKFSVLLNCHDHDFSILTNLLIDGAV